MEVEMNAEQLIQAYRDDAITARELVEGVWVLVACCDGSYRDYPQGTALRELAADFTISRIEEIRLVKKEIAQLCCAIEQGEAHERESRYNKKTWRHTTDIWKRILAREQFALAELSRGIRPEVL
jgi:hypothetical protein